MLQSDITKEMEWFTGTDIQLVFAIYEDDDETPIEEDMTGWEWSWMFKRRISDTDANALITKSGGDVFLGTHPDLDIPAIFVQLSEEDYAAIEFTGDQRTLSGHHELKRMDDGQNTIYSYGKAKLRRAVHASA